MIKAKDAITKARSLIGTPYAELDCINLIKKVIRTASGGVPSYTTAGTNALWNSFEMSAKYKDLTERHEGIENVPAGAIPFKADGSDKHHAGIATGEGTVIHSSSTQGGRGVVETPLTAAEGWNCWGVHRYIETGTEEENVMYTARVNLNSPKSSLNLRNGPSTIERRIGSIPHGTVVDVLAEAGDWLYVRYNGLSGYASAEYLEAVNTEEKPAEDTTVPTESEEPVFTTIINEDGTPVRLAGRWRVAED